ncbi:MAG: substrate-binding domain-containing protein [Chloroflexi bacterium]|nr:substrate-binding domain-containing protein [Chloroflexota bacterium]
MAKHRPTQADVARLANVSQTTVSYVLNGITTISVPEETRQRILAAAQTLNYVPDYAARSLRTRKTHTIAAIIPDIANPFYPAFARAVQDIARQHNYDLILYNTDELADEEQKCLRSVERGRVDGMIIVPFHSSPDDLCRLIERNIPVVVVGTSDGPYGGILNTVGTDDIAVATVAVTHLIDKGHVRIAMIVGTDSPPHRTRIKGYRRALQSAGISYEQIANGGAFNEVGGYDAMQQILQSAQRPTAVFAANDLMAIGAMRALKESNLRVPEDVAIIGIDNIPAASLMLPALTTVNPYPERKGQRAAEVLFQVLNGTHPASGQHEEIPYQLIVRDSA